MYTGLHHIKAYLIISVFRYDILMPYEPFCGKLSMLRCIWSYKKYVYLTKQLIIWHPEIPHPLYFYAKIIRMIWNWLYILLIHFKLTYKTWNLINIDTNFWFYSLSALFKSFLWWSANSSVSLPTHSGSGLTNYLLRIILFRVSLISVIHSNHPWFIHWNYVVSSNMCLKIQRNLILAFQEGLCVGTFKLS